MGGYRLRQRLTYAGVRQTEIIVHVIQGQLLPQPVFALAQRADPAPDRGDMLPETLLLASRVVACEAVVY